MSNYSDHTPNFTPGEAHKAAPVQKAPRNVPELTHEQSKLYKGIGASRGFSLKKFAAGFARTK